VRFLLILINLTLFTGNSWAGWRDLAASQFQIAPMPSSGSAEALVDLQTMIDSQENRSQKTCDYANDHFDYDFVSMYKGFLSTTQISKVKSFMDDVFNTTGRIVNVFKAKYARSYPFVAYSAKIHPCVPTTGGTTSFSYPSGHTTGGIVSACALAVIFPDQAADIWKHGEYQGDLRVIIGRHYPTDVKAGKQLGQAICKMLRQDPEFVREAEALR
jgi:acid phosphatase (class A)